MRIGLFFEDNFFEQRRIFEWENPNLKKALSHI